MKQKRRTDIYIAKLRKQSTHMKYKGTLVVVKDCRRALRFYQDLFGFELIRDNDGNMELSGGLYLQEQKYWESFTGKSVVFRNNSTELYFEEPELEAFIGKLQKLYPDTVFVNPLMTQPEQGRMV